MSAEQGLPELNESEEISALREELDSRIDEMSEKLSSLSDWIGKHPEPGFLEFEAMKRLTEELASHGFEIQTDVPGLEEAWPEYDRLKYVGGLTPDYDGPAGLPTAFRAKYHGKSESPVIGIVVEYDALRGDPPFHGCQHNMQGPTGIGAAIALAQVMEEHDLPGSVWVIGAPAEEVGPPAKAALARAGYIDGVDFALRSHGTEHNNETVRYVGGFSARHIEQMKYTFHGKSAHAQMAWHGRSALDAVLVLFHAMEMMREHSEPQFRFHGVINEGGVAPNIVPERAAATLWVRHLMDETEVGAVSPRKAREMILAKREEIDNAARGAALATGTTVDIDHYGSYIPSVAVGALLDLEFHYAVKYGGVNIRERPVPRHFEETGFMSLKVPGVNVTFGVEGVPTVPGHSHENEALSMSPEGHKSLVLTTKAMAAIGLRLVADPDVAARIKAEHAEWLAKYNA